MQHSMQHSMLHLPVQIPLRVMAVLQILPLALQSPFVPTAMRFSAFTDLSHTQMTWLAHQDIMWSMAKCRGCIARRLLSSKYSYLA